MRKLRNLGDKLSLNRENTAEFVQEKLKRLEKKNNELHERVHEFPFSEGKHECCDEKPNKRDTSKREWSSKAAELHNKATRLRERSTTPQAELTKLLVKVSKIKLEIAKHRAQEAYAMEMSKGSKDFHFAVVDVGDADGNEGINIIESKAAAVYERILIESEYHCSAAMIQEMREAIKSTSDWAKEAGRCRVEKKASEAKLNSLENDCSVRGKAIDKLLVEAIELDAYAAYASVKAKPMYEATIIDRKAIEELLKTLKENFKLANQADTSHLTAQLKETLKKEGAIIKEKQQLKEKTASLEIELSELKKTMNNSKVDNLAAEKVQKKLKEAEARAREKKQSADKKISELEGEIVGLKKSMASAGGLAKENVQLQNKLKETESKAEDEKKSAENEIADLKGELVDLKKSMAKAGNLENDNAKLQKKLAETEVKVEKEKQSAKKKIADLQEEILNLKKSAEIPSETEKQMKELQSTLDLAEAMLADGDKQVVELEETNIELKKRMKSLKARDNELQHRIESMAEEMERMRKAHTIEMERALLGEVEQDDRVPENEDVGDEDSSDYSL